MKSRNLKLVGILALLVAFTFTMAACDMGDTGVDTPEEDAHGVSVTVDLSDDLVKAQGDVSVLTLEENIEIDSLKVTLGEDTKTITHDPDGNGESIEFGGQITVTFEDVEPGDYNVKAELLGDIDDGDEAKKLYESGDKNINVSADELVKVDLKVMPLEWESLDVTLNDVSDQEAIVERIERITLKHPAMEGNEETKDNGWEHEDVVNFDADELDAIPARWHLILEFDSEDIANPDAIEILLLPTEEKEIELDIDYTKGLVEVDVDIHKSPDAPTEVSIDDEGLLTWVYNDADKFAILRDQDNSEYLEPVDEVDGGITEFDLQGKKAGQYYVRAYVDGYSSDKTAADEKFESVELDGQDFVDMGSEIYITDSERIKGYMVDFNVLDFDVMSEAVSVEVFDDDELLQKNIMIDGAIELDGRQWTTPFIVDGTATFDYEEDGWWYVNEEGNFKEGADGWQGTIEDVPDKVRVTITVLGVDYSYEFDVAPGPYPGAYVKNETELNAALEDPDISTIIVAEGETIEVSTGDGHGIKIGRDEVTLKAENNNAIIDAQGEARAIDFDAHGVRVEGFKIDNFGETAFYTGEFHHGPGNQFEIVNNVVPEDIASHGVSTAINIDDADGGLIEGNKLYSQHVEHPVSEGFSTPIINLGSSAENIEIRDNTVYTSTLDLTGLGVISGATGTIIEDNIFDGDDGDYAVTGNEFDEDDVNDIIGLNTFQPDGEVENSTIVITD